MHSTNRDASEFEDVPVFIILHPNGSTVKLITGIGAKRDGEDNCRLLQMVQEGKINNSLTNIKYLMKYIISVNITFQKCCGHRSILITQLP